MPQIQLPVFPDGVTEINQNLGVQKRDGQVVYFNGLMPVFMHAESDLQTFRMITSQFVVNGNAREVEVIKAFGVPASTVKRYVRLYREQGPAGFYVTRRRRGPVVLTPEVLAHAQKLLNEGQDVAAVAAELEIKPNTLSKAVLAGRLQRLEKKLLPLPG
jgi:transposase